MHSLVRGHPPLYGCLHLSVWNIIAEYMHACREWRATVNVVPGSAVLYYYHVTVFGMKAGVVYSGT